MAFLGAGFSRFSGWFSFLAWPYHGPWISREGLEAGLGPPLRRRLWSHPSAVPVPAPHNPTQSSHGVNCGQLMRKRLRS